MRTLLVVVLLLALPSAARPAAPPRPIDQAIRLGLARLQQGATNYISNRQCFSCHHQSLTIAAFIAARDRGFEVSSKFLQEQTTFTIDTFKSKIDKVRKGEDVGGRSTTVAYALYTLQTSGHRPDETTDALIDFLLVRQEKDGSWPATTQRNPSEGSKFTNAALALAALKHYAPRDRSKAARAEKSETAFRKGVEWLEKSKPVDTEDRAFRLRALVAGGADNRLIAEARRELVGQQLSDGSWRQLSSLQGDAYATATVLVALRQAGMKPTDAIIERGVAYLLRTQSPEGAWIVTTRSRPIQRWFDNGDPGGKNQFISFLATGWATLALLESSPGR